MREWEKRQDKKKTDIYFISGEYFNSDDVMAEFRTKGDVKEATNIWCLKKPIDVKRLKEIVGKYQR